MPPVINARPGMPRSAPSTFHGRGCAARKPAPRYVPPLPPPDMPKEIDGALWQPGVTANAHRFKILFNGEPCPGAIAAGDGWVVVLPEPELVEVRVGRHAPLGMGWRIDPIRGTRRLEGDVRIVRIGGRGQ